MTTETNNEIEVKNCEMDNTMKERACEIMRNAVDQCQIERDMALFIKKQMDREFGPKWHCIAGRHFSSHVSYDPHHYLYVQLGRRVFLLFKAG